MINSIHRFHGRNSLRFVYQQGRQFRGELLSLRVAPNARQRAWRVAVVVSRKVSKSAVVRNRIRRRIFEVVRSQGSRIAGPYDLIFNIYAESVATMQAAELQRIVLEQLEKASVLKGSASGVNHGIVRKKETL